MKSYYFLTKEDLKKTKQIVGLILSYDSITKKVEIKEAAGDDDETRYMVNSKNYKLNDELKKLIDKFKEDQGKNKTLFDKIVEAVQYELDSGFSYNYDDPSLSYHYSNFIDTVYDILKEEKKESEGFKRLKKKFDEDIG